MSAQPSAPISKSQDLHHDKILILDFGAQYTQLIARRIREFGVYCEIWAWDHDPAESPGSIRRASFCLVAPNRRSKKIHRVHRRKYSIPACRFSGICYGMQTMAMQLGGEVEAGHHREFGYAEVEVTAPCALLDDLKDHPGSPPSLDVWMSHGDRVTQIPEGFEITARTGNVPIIGMSDESKKWYGVQFHPEVTHTKSGEAMLRRFAVDLRLSNLMDCSEYYRRSNRPRACTGG